MIVTTVALCTYDRSAHTVGGRRPRAPPAKGTTSRGRRRPLSGGRGGAWSSHHHHQKTTLTENVIGGCKSWGHRGHHWQTRKKTRVARIGSYVHFSVSLSRKFLQWWILKSMISLQKNLTYSNEIFVFWEYHDWQFVKKLQIWLSKLSGVIFHNPNSRN